MTEPGPLIISKVKGAAPLLGTIWYAEDVGSPRTSSDTSGFKRASTSSKLSSAGQPVMNTTISIQTLKDLKIFMLYFSESLVFSKAQNVYQGDVFQIDTLLTYNTY